ncbi:putative transporter [Wickerhamomyces ciferrii]|uniref:Transporter n=1 Tax=Wickerhamomyces ciferrii (strain ATCC 14091 / BCRC 22168 / CBS 111 / JCM 3599 / NBRC 0793 / NRRL Y-1031 F-60-10) TaxID=1206466 RepID=K0KKC6_WICCF|nr:putative transporter [Wickerhamomyces ciferrii]CCH43406.1 putative transporter [Wickerhamomyces ciferrii]
MSTDVESNKEKNDLLIQKVESLNSNQAHVDEKDADATLKFLEQYGDKVTEDITPTIEKKIRRKLYIWLVPLLMTINTMLFLDKSVLSYGILLGLFESTGISHKQYNDLNSIFYAGYFFGQIPLHFFLQKFNFAKFVSLILFSWAILIFLTATANNYGGLIVLRFLLGFFESIVIPAIEITLLQFFTPKERASINPLFWISSQGPTEILGGFISYGLLHLKNPVTPPWKLFMVIVGGLTLLNATWSFFIYPSNPSDAKFLTIEERVHLIRKIQHATHSSIEQKTIKKHQIIETIKDPLTWLFTSFGLLSMIHNNIMFQANILYEAIGVERLGITLIGVVGGCFGSVYLLSGVFLIRFLKEGQLIAILYAGIPALAASLGMVLIPWDKSIPLIAMLLLTRTFALAFIVVVGWSTSSASGYTKKFYRNIFFMFGYCVANVISPQIWTEGKGNESPRYYTAWSIQIVISFFIPLVIAVIIHVILKKRNNERLKYIEENPDAQYGQVVVTDPNTGEQVIEKVEIANLDLTDLENKTFIYPL